MEAIKKKMEVLKNEAASSTERAELAEKTLKEANDRAEVAEASVQALENKLILLEVHILTSPHQLSIVLATHFTTRSE